MKVSVSVMAHPARRKAVDRLRASLGADVPVSWDEEGPPSSDAQKRWRNGARAWGMADDRADYHLVVQDDALPCPDLLHTLPLVFANVPGPGPVSLYMGARSGNANVQRLTRRAQDSGAAWLGLELLGWGVAFAVHTSEIDDMLAVCQARERDPYDLRIGKYFRNVRHLPTWYTWPSLVDHDLSQRSLVGHVGSHRRALRVPRESPNNIYWGADAVVDERAQVLADAAKT